MLSSDSKRREDHDVLGEGLTEYPGYSVQPSTQMFVFLVADNPVCTVHQTQISDCAWSNGQPMEFVSHKEAMDYAHKMVKEIVT